MRTIDDIAVNGADVLKALLLEAYRAGYEVGTREGAAELRTKLAQLLAKDAEVKPDMIDAGGVSVGDRHVRPVETDSRAIPGTVKPAILDIVRENPIGVTRAQIEKLTGFKPNSIRGTLWTLMTEKAIARRGDKFVPSEELESAGQEPSPEPPADQEGVFD